MSTAASLFRRELTITQLTAGFEKHVAGRSVAGRDGMTPEQFRGTMRPEFELICRNALSGTYRFSPYKQHLLSKGLGKPPRVVSIASVRDRVLLKAMANVLSATFDDARTPLAPEMVAVLVKALEAGIYDSYIRIDVKDFYPNVRHAEVLATLRTRVRFRPLIEAVMMSIRTPTVSHTSARPTFQKCVGVPQGLPISNILAEMSMRQVDAELHAIDRTRYFRYVDDILMLCQRGDMPVLRDLTIDTLKRYGLEAHPFEEGSKSTSGAVASKFDYLGYEFEWPRVSVRPSSIAKLENSLAKVFTSHKKYVASHDDIESRRRALLRCSLWIDLKVSGCVYEGSRRGWISFYSQIRHQQLLRHLDDYVKLQIKRFNLTDLIEPKRFVDSYRYATRRKRDLTGYVPVFDDLDPDAARDVLDRYFLFDVAELRRMPDSKVAEIFKKKMHQMVVELERDVSRPS